MRALRLHITDHGVELSGHGFARGKRNVSMGDSSNEEASATDGSDGNDGRAGRMPLLRLALPRRIRHSGARRDDGGRRPVRSLQSLQHGRPGWRSMRAHDELRPRRLRTPGGLQQRVSLPSDRGPRLRGGACAILNALRPRSMVLRELARRGRGRAVSRYQGAGRASALGAEKKVAPPPAEDPGGGCNRDSRLSRRAPTFALGACSHAPARGLAWRQTASCLFRGCPKSSRFTSPLPKRGEVFGRLLSRA